MRMIRYRFSCREIFLLFIITMLVISLTFTSHSDRILQSQTVEARVPEVVPSASWKVIQELKIVVDPTKTRFLTITPLDGRAGRLGNFCFRYAAALGIAARNNMTLVLPDTLFVREMTKLFQLKVLLESEVDMSKVNFTKTHEKHWGVFDENLFHIEAKHASLTYVYSQSWRYFDHVKSQVREQLQLDSTTLKAKADLIVSGLRDLYKKHYVVGIHVRRGDFLKPSLAKFGYAVATSDFFTHATKWFINKYGADNLLFLVTSDDIPWCKNNINFQGAEHLFSLTSEPKEDFARLISCDHHIVSVGSFGWWSAWLGNGDVVYYKDFPTPNSNHAKNHDHFDYYPQNWVGMT